MTIKIKRVNGLEMYQIVNGTTVVKQFWSKAGMVTWLLSQKAGV